MLHRYNVKPLLCTIERHQISMVPSGLSSAEKSDFFAVVIDISLILSRFSGSNRSGLFGDWFMALWLVATWPSENGELEIEKPFWELRWDDYLYFHFAVYCSLTSKSFGNEIAPWHHDKLLKIWG